MDKMRQGMAAALAYGILASEETGIPVIVAFRLIETGNVEFWLNGEYQGESKEVTTQDRFKAISEELSNASLDRLLGISTGAN